MRVLTWNLLHRVHAENYDEPTVERWPDEAARARAIVSFLADVGPELALLQEVSGDVLAALRLGFPDFAVLSHTHARVPRSRRAVRSLSDPQEHLVVIAPRGAQVSGALSFANDLGKGLLAVRVSPQLSVVTTHVSWGPKREPQLEVLAQLLAETPPGETVCVGGDFNAGAEVLALTLGREASIATPPPGSLRTRAEGAGGDIDHLLCRGCALHEVRVLEQPGLSDHRPVMGLLAG